MGIEVLATALGVAVTTSATDGEFARAARGWFGQVCLVDADSNTMWSVLIDDGRARLDDADSTGTNAVSHDIVLSAPATTWLGMLDPSPGPFLHDLSGAQLHGLTVGGDRVVIAQRWAALNRLVQLARGSRPVAVPAPGAGAPGAGALDAGHDAE